MRTSKRRLLALAALAGSLAGCAAGGAGGGPAGGNPAVDLLVQTDALQAEVRRLRDQVEVLSHELEGVKRRQRELYADLDRRLREQERTAAPGPGAGAGGGTQGAGGPAAERTDAQAAYDAAFDLMKQSRYRDAIQAFQAFLARYGDSVLAADARYWIGEAHYVTRDFDQALAAFQELVQKYPDSDKLPDAMLKIGYIQLEKGEQAAGRQTLEDLLRRYPGSPAAVSAERRLKSLS